MKKLLLIATGLIMAAGLNAAFTPTVSAKKNLNASEVMIPIGGTDQKISLKALSEISATELEQITGRKMSWAQKLSFKSTQRKLKKTFDENGTITSKKLLKQVDADNLTAGFHLGGFALGFLLTLIGVLIAYLINDDKKQGRVKWAWIGFGISVVLIILFMLL